MNMVSLIGRLTKDPEVRYTKESLAICNFTLAVERKKKEQDEKADFINILAFGKFAENMEKYLKKGSKIGVNGRIQTSNYMNKEGNRVYKTEVVLEQMHFLDNKAKTDSINNLPDGFEYSDLEEDDLPF